MAFPPEFLDELRARHSLAGVIGRRVRLAKRGRELIGLCPFHNEKTPSFTVSEEKGFFHCFGCGAHGDVIGFAMQSDGLSFPEAVEKLAGEVGLALPARTPESRAAEQRARSLYDVTEAAAAWFEAQLRGDVGAGARKYLEGRGLTRETVAEFRLGYAPAARTALKQALLAKGIDERLLVDAGLLIVPEDGGASYDRFRDRVIFPITNRAGRTIAFGGRALGDAKAKYLNSPETPLFHKGRVLYNLPAASRAARESDTVLVAEGYMDVIALSAAGFASVVAPLGTALTEGQMSELWRLAPEPVLCLDGDQAGLNAAYRAAERCLPLLKPGCSLRFALLPEGEDPDTLVRRRGREAMARVIDTALALDELLWRRETQGRRIDTPERRAAVEANLLALAGTCRDATVREHYRRHFKSRVWEAFKAPRAGRGTASGHHRRAPRRGRVFEAEVGFQSRSDIRSSAQALLSSTGNLERYREHLLLLAPLNHPHLLDRVAEVLAGEQFASPELDRLRGAMIEAGAMKKDLDTKALKRHLTDRGFTDTMAEVCGRQVALHGRFARPAAPLDEVERSWFHILMLHRRYGSLRAQIAEALAEFERETTDSNKDRLYALLLQAQSAAADEAGYGGGTSAR